LRSVLLIYIIASQVKLKVQLAAIIENLKLLLLLLSWDGNLSTAAASSKKKERKKCFII